MTKFELMPVCFEPKVNKIDIQYDKVSKQVDVHALKEVLWNHIHASAETGQVRHREKNVPELYLNNQVFFLCL
jgi:condensin complex subunit 2